MKKYGAVLILSFLCFHLQANCIKGNCNFGRGKVVFQNGNVYEGAFQNGLPDGKGIMKYHNGDKYLGTWSQGYRNGKGKHIENKGEFYLGEWFKDSKHGKGAQYHNDGSVTEGIWENNVLSEVISTATGYTNTIAPTTSIGHNTDMTNKESLRNCNKVDCGNQQGFYTYGDGSIYTGAFVQGKPHGEGVLKYASGNIYKGQWSNHAPNGEGTMIFPTGQKVHAIWNNAKVVKKLKYKRNKQKLKNNTHSKFTSETKIWAVIVGIAAYNHMPSLKYTDDDAYKMYAFLKSPEGGALPDEQVKILIDDSATKEEILEAMEEVYLRADENDMIMLYYSGHGLDGSFIPFDFDGMNNQLLHTEINEIFDLSKAKHKVCYADACYSGSYANAKGGVMEAMNSYYDKLQSTTSSTAIMMSSQQNEVSLEYMGLRQGIFSHYLLRGMKGEADIDYDKTITIQELFGFVNKHVKTYTSNIQSPILAGSYDRKMPVSFVR